MFPGYIVFGLGLLTGFLFTKVGTPSPLIDSPPIPKVLVEMTDAEFAAAQAKGNAGAVRSV